MTNKEDSPKYKLAILTSHPIQYHVPLFQKIAQHSRIDLMVYFCSDYGVTEKIDPGFGVAFKWDIPLLEGYSYKFLKNYLPGISGGRLWLSFNPGIIKELWKERYDAVLIHGYVALSNWLAIIGARLNNTSVILRGETILRHNQNKLLQFIKKAYLKLFFSRIKAFLPIGTRSREFFLTYGVPESRMFPTPYSVDNEFFIEQREIWQDNINEIKEELGIPKDTPVILYASKITKRKHPMDILKAFEKLKEKATLVFVGDGNSRPTLEKYVERRNIGNVFFVGFKNQSELPKYYTIADVFVLPSSYEPWGLAINEAMCFGLPIITTEAVAASADLVCHGENGFIYPVGDIDKLTNSLSKLLQETELRIKMGKRSSEIIAKWSYKEDEEGILASLEYVKRGN
ncbi:MAG: glycosyltransferase [Thermodesulfovibrionales bacterium]|nr:glycosyltransferase [Thermodesulfovibrionales bacterium]